jgi:hypothetical protein
LGEQAGHAGADPSAGPGDDRDPAFKQVSHDPSPLVRPRPEELGQGVWSILGLAGADCQPNELNVG